MKLEYIYDNNSNLKRIIYVSILIFVFGFSFWICLGYLEYGFDGFSNMLYMLVGLTICLLLFLFYGVIPFIISFFVNKKRRKISNEIRKNGIKKVGYIYAGYPTHNYKTAFYTSRYVFLVNVDYECYSIDWICDNKACMSVVRFLKDCDKKRTKKLCNRFDYLQFRDNDKIYIDVYFYGDKIYGDLQSVDMVKIKEKTDI